MGPLLFSPSLSLSWLILSLSRSAITEGAGVKVCFDALGGGDVASAIMGSMAQNGNFYVYGLLEFGKPLK